MRIMARSSSNKNSASAPRQLGFADSGGAEKDEGADRPVWIFQPGARPHDRFGDGHDGFVLPDDALVQLFAQMKQLLHFPLEKLDHGNAGPAADDLGDVLFVDFFLDQARGALFLREVFFLGLELAVQVVKLAELQLGGPGIIVGTLGLLDFNLGVFNLLAQTPSSWTDPFSASHCGAGSWIAP